MDFDGMVDYFPTVGNQEKTIKKTPPFGSELLDIS